MWFFPLLVVLAWVGLALATRGEHRRMPRLTGTLPRPPERARVLAIVPARDEEEVVGSCLRGLLLQQGVELRAVLYDDRSRDGTARIVEDIARDSGGRLTLVHGTEEPPKGWCGKNHALVAAFRGIGYDIHRGRMADDVAPHVILFLDADVVLRPTAVAELAELMQERGLALASALPHLVCRSFWEKVVGPTVGGLVTAKYRPSRVNSRDSTAALANGQFMMVTPEAYGYVGGHEAVKGEVLEDVALASLIKRAGHPIMIADGQKVVSTRMYDSLGELWRGWGKNAFRLVGGTAGRALGYATASVALGFAPTACLVGGVALLAGGSAAGWAWLAAWGISLGVQMALRRVGGQAAGYAVFAPLGAAVLAALLVKATWTALRGGRVQWKGRDYVDGAGVAR